MFDTSKYNKKTIILCMGIIVFLISIIFLRLTKPSYICDVQVNNQGLIYEEISYKKIIKTSIIISLTFMIMFAIFYNGFITDQYKEPEKIMSVHSENSQIEIVNTKE